MNLFNNPAFRHALGVLVSVLATIITAYLTNAVGVQTPLTPKIIYVVPQ